MNFLIIFQDDTWLKERYRDNLLTHPDLDPDLWLEARLFDKPDRNWVYNLSHTTVEDLQAAHSVSIVGCSKSISSTPTLEFKVILNQQVQAQSAYLNAHYARLGAKTFKLHQLVMKKTKP